MKLIKKQKNIIKKDLSCKLKRTNIIIRPLRTSFSINIKFKKRRKFILINKELKIKQKLKVIQSFKNIKFELNKFNFYSKGIKKEKEFNLFKEDKVLFNKDKLKVNSNKLTCDYDNSSTESVVKKGINKNQEFLTNENKK